MNKSCKYIIVLIITIIIFGSCKKDETEYVPNVYVNFQIDPNSTMYLGLNQVGGWVYITGGVKGIIIYKIDNQAFMAYDRACPHDPEITDAAVEVESSGLTMIDNYCGSRFIITDGSVVSGPSKYGLKQYKTFYDGNYLHVSN